MGAEANGGLPHGGVPQIVSPHQPLTLLIDQINVDLTLIVHSNSCNKRDTSSIRFKGSGSLSSFSLGSEVMGKASANRLANQPHWSRWCSNQLSYAPTNSARIVASKNDPFRPTQAPNCVSPCPHQPPISRSATPSLRVKHLTPPP